MAAPRTHDMNNADGRASTRLRCTACESDRVRVFFRIPEAPVLCNVLCDSREAAVAMPRAPIELAYCRACGLVF
ncbi:MAG: hypothetical protein D6744_16840, partial [Planctomycetota bacterium]